MRRLVLVYFSLFVTSGLQANYGVSLGSYTEVVRADKALSIARTQFQQDLSIAVVESGSNIFHRVIAGPFVDRSSAVNFADVARNTGYTGVWISTLNAHPEILSRSEVGGSDTVSQFDVGRELQKYDALRANDQSTPQRNSIYSDGPELTEVPLSPGREVPLSKEKNDAQVIAPAGFGLNKMRRD